MNPDNIITYNTDDMANEVKVTVSVTVSNWWRFIWARTDGKIRMVVFYAFGHTVSVSKWPGHGIEFNVEEVDEL